MTDAELQAIGACPEGASRSDVTNLLAEIERLRAAVEYRDRCISDGERERKHLLERAQAEREACAKVAETFRDDGGCASSTGGMIADAIRDRSNPAVEQPAPEMGVGEEREPKK